MKLKRIGMSSMAVFILVMLAALIWTGFSLVQASVTTSDADLSVHSRLGVANAVGECPQTATHSIFLPLTTGGAGGATMDFTVNLPSCLLAVEGYNGDVQVYVTANDGFSEPITLSLENTPTGVTGTFNPATISGSGTSTLTLSLADGTEIDGYSLALQGTSGDSVVQDSFRLEVVEPLLISGQVEFTDQTGIDGALITAHLEGQEVMDSAVTANGSYTVELPALSLPARVLIEASLEQEGFPSVDNFKWQYFESRGNVQMQRILMPNPAQTQMTISDGNAETADGSIDVEGLPPEIDRLFGETYDPDADRDVFPGDFTENGEIPLNSANFLWMEALDADGNPVDALSQAATIRSLVPQSQWIDLEDIDIGTDRIETPIYTFNETSNMWEQMGIGWLEDAQRTILPEEAESVIINGTFEGQIYAVFETVHFSWMNVDYAFIGPWTLSRLDSSKRNNDCLYNALQLAKTIALSEAGQNAYAQFNKPDGDLEEELADAAGPELKNDDLGGNYGEFKGNEQGDRDDQFYISNDIWDDCGEGATEEEKKNATLMMAVTILHETAHWKWDTKHEDGDWQNAEPGGEAGNELEKDLFGGIITGDGDGIKRDGSPLSNQDRDQWLDASNWPAPSDLIMRESKVTEGLQEPSISMTLSLSQPQFELGEEITATIEYENLLTESVQLLDLALLEGYPIWFELYREGEATRVPFRGNRIKRNIDFAQDSVTLQPGQSLQQEYTLLRDQNGQQAYKLINSGSYSMTAFYSSHWGLPETSSNTATFTLGAGGSISGNITNASTGGIVMSATVEALLDGIVLDSATSDQNGNYTFPELPSGSYTLTVSAPGFLNSSQGGVQVVAGQNTIANLSLSPLLVQGQLSMVLTWGESPSDLDSHLWLPEANPYHIYYSRRGNLAECPFANLDVDDTSSFGPETITIAQRFLTGSYSYAIYNFSGSPNINASQAQVQVFDSTGLIATFNVPTEGEGLWWHVLNVDGETGAITEVNQIVSDSPEPYPDTASGCDILP